PFESSSKCSVIGCTACCSSGGDARAAAMISSWSWASPGMEVYLASRKRTHFHLMQALAGWDHRVDVLIGLDEEIDQDRAVVVDHLVNRLRHVFLLLAADALDATRL